MKITPTLATIATMIFVTLFVIIAFATGVFGAVSFQDNTKTQAYEYHSLLAATTTTATSTNISGGGGYAVIAGAKKVTAYFSRGGTAGANTGSTLFKIQVSPEGSTWQDWGKLVQSTSTVTQTTAAITAATSTLLYGVDIDQEAFYGIRCVAVETTDGEHTCAVGVEF